MAEIYNLTLQVAVSDPAALFAEARAYAIKDGMTEAEADDSLLMEAEDDAAAAEEGAEPRMVPDVGACLQMLLDPGVSPDGCTIEESSATYLLDWED